MRLEAIACLLVPALSAQVMPPSAPLARGAVLERDAQPAGGEFSIRLDNYEVIRYRFDGRTAVEREDYPIDVPRLHPGERVEVLADEVPGSLIGYARTVRSLEDTRQPVPPSARRTRAWSFEAARPYAEDDPLFGRGDLTFSGVISHLNASHLVLHTRQGERTILLGANTRYLDNGEIATAGALSPNMHVFVRASRNLYDEFEGRQVVWGEILEPK